MSKSKVVLCAIVALLGVNSVVLAESDVSVGVTADFNSKYVWRGINVVDDWVFQPGVSVGYMGFTGGIWGNLDLTDENGNSGEFTEVDYTLDYSGQITDMIGFSVGAIYYDFPNTGFDGTTELYGGINFDVLLSPSITVYRDVDEVEGTYVSLGVGHSLELPESVPFGVDLGASLGWGDEDYNIGYWTTDSSELNDLALSAAFPFEVGPVTVTPAVTYVALLGSDIKDSVADDDVVFAGVGLAYDF